MSVSVSPSVSDPVLKKLLFLDLFSLSSFLLFGAEDDEGPRCRPILPNNPRLCTLTNFSACFCENFSTSVPGNPAVSFLSMNASPGTSYVGVMSGEVGSDGCVSSMVGAMKLRVDW